MLFLGLSVVFALVAAGAVGPGVRQLLHLREDLANDNNHISILH